MMWYTGSCDGCLFYVINSRAAVITRRLCSRIDCANKIEVCVRAAKQTQRQRKQS